MFGFGKSRRHSGSGKQAQPSAELPDQTLELVSPELKSADGLPQSEIARHLARNLREMSELALRARLERAACLIEMAADISQLESGPSER